MKNKITKTYLEFIDEFGNVLKSLLPKQLYMEKNKTAGVYSFTKIQETKSDPYGYTPMPRYIYDPYPLFKKIQENEGDSIYDLIDFNNIIGEILSYSGHNKWLYDKFVSGNIPYESIKAFIVPIVMDNIIDSPDNNSVYSNLIVEAGELKDAIKNVQYNYGIYSKGLQLFYDDGILYVLNKCNNQHSYQKDEMNLITVKINERTDRPDANDFVIVGKDGIGYERRSKLMKEDYESVEGIYTGDKFVYSNYGSIINSGFGGDNGTTFVSPLNEVVKPRKSRVDVGVKKIVDYDMLNNYFTNSLYEENNINNNQNINLIPKPVNNDVNDEMINYKNFHFNNKYMNKLLIKLNAKNIEENNYLNLKFHDDLLQKIIEALFNTNKIFSKIIYRLSLELIDRKSVV